METERGGLPIIAFADSASWTAWLAARPATSKGVWLKLAKAASGLATISKREAIDGALCHGWIDGQLDKFDADYWLIRFTPRKSNSKWSAINRDRAKELIALGQMTPAGKAEIERARADGRWEAAYAPQSRSTVPDDLAMALEASPDALAFFQTLGGANRYAILYRIGNAKRQETRAQLIAKFVNMCARGETVHGPAKVNRR